MGDDRVIFGSDWPHIEALPAPTDYLSELRKFDAPTVRKIMRENTLALTELRRS
jgi:predicted TIM-barrel fold metal-dependent hydrolase